MKIDLHVHSTYSSDSTAKMKDIMMAAKRAGLDGIAITDHDTCDGWADAKREARKSGLSIVLGEEVKILKNGARVGDALALFIKEPVKVGSLGEIIDQVKGQGGIVGIAHPFDNLRSSFYDIEPVDSVDFIEAYNARVFFGWMNDKAASLARKHKLGMTGGSDAHTTWEVGNAYTYADALDLEGFRKELIEGRATAHGKRTSPLLRVFSKIAKLFK